MFIGVGGVMFMMLFIFYVIDFLVCEVGSGLVVFVLIGMVVCLLSGVLFDWGICCFWLVRGIILLVIVVDLVLL